MPWVCGGLCPPPHTGKILSFFAPMLGFRNKGLVLFYLGVSITYICPIMSYFPCAKFS